MGTQGNAEATSGSGLVDVGTTKLYQEVHGSGPPLLLISSGGGDAAQWAHLVPLLAGRFTVVTYDRRGFSRSPRPAGWAATSVAEHTDDAAALLRVLDLAPAVVAGHSSGAAIACDLVARYPQLVRHAVIYEPPPVLAVVPDAQRAMAELRARVQQAMAEGGPRTAMEAFMRGNVGDEVFESIDPGVRNRALANGAVFLQIELPAFVAFTPDRDRLRATGVPLTVLVGAQNRDNWLGATATWLAEGTGAELVELPGGHAGLWTHPEPFANLVLRIADRAHDPRRTAALHGRRSEG
jgi:pimeloyl-ACP methyl ester carboxylesterase